MRLLIFEAGTLVVMLTIFAAYLFNHQSPRPSVRLDRWLTLVFNVLFGLAVLAYLVGVGHLIS